MPLEINVGYDAGAQQGSLSTSEADSMAWMRIRQAALDMERESDSSPFRDVHEIHTSWSSVRRIIGQFSNLQSKLGFRFKVLPEARGGCTHLLEREGPRIPNHQVWDAGRGFPHLHRRDRGAAGGSWASARATAETLPAEGPPYPSVSAPRGQFLGAGGRQDDRDPGPSPADRGA